MGKDRWKEGVCEILMMLSMNDGAMETMEYMWVEMHFFGMSCSASEYTK